MAGELFTGVDAAWLRMDRPGNLAQIAGVMVFDTPIDRARLIELVHERLLVYDRFRQRVREPLLGLGLPRWEIDPHFDLNYHLPQISLPAPGGQLELQRLVGDLMSQPLDRSRPLWRIYYVDNYQDGCALVPVLHHCIADGLALVQVLLAMTDPPIVGAVSINLLSEMLRPLEIWKWIFIPLLLILVMIFRRTGLIAFRDFDPVRLIQSREKSKFKV